jgi:urease accessory protein
VVTTTTIITIHTIKEVLAMNLMNKAIAGVFLMAVSPLVFAHPGHLSGGLYAGLSHPLTGLDHLMALVLAGILIGTGKAGKARMLIPAMVSALAVGALAGVFLGSQSWIEASIMLSIPVFLVVHFLSANMIRKIALGVYSGFFVAHGWAHGVEMSGDPLTFILGFLFSSAMVMLLSAFVTRKLTEYKMTRMHGS